MFNRWTVLYLLIAGAFFIASLVMQLGFDEGFQAAMWLLFLTLICCSLAYNKARPRFQRNVVVIIVGSLFVFCTVLAACAFAAGLATRTLDRTAFGLGLVVTLLGVPLTVFWTKAGLAKRESDALVMKDDDGITKRNCLDSTGCTVCANIWWILLGILIVIFTAEVIGEVVDARRYIPADEFLVTIPADAEETYNSSLTGTTGRDDPRILTTHERHVECTGSGSPLIVLEHGRGGSIWDWAWVQKLITESPSGSRVCAFSRSGYGFSSRGDRPRSAAQTSLELKAMLISLNLDVPFIHVGHSWGGMALRMYQRMYPEQVLAQVFVDAVHAPCMALCDANKPTPSSMYRFFAALGGTGIPRALAASGALPMNGSGLLAVLPEEARAPRLATIVSPQFWQTWTDENEELSLSCEQVKRLGNVNITTFKTPVRNVLAETGVYYNSNGNYACGETLAELSTPAGSTIVVQGAPHIELLFDRQFATTVADEILDVLQKVRDATP